MDEVSMFFAQNFYKHLALGNTVKQSFEDAIRTVQASNIDFTYTCDQHVHKSWCGWYNGGKP